eukprot:scaffold18648_cov124-Isochrysis_galbana.AAC.6
MKNTSTCMCHFSQATLGEDLNHRSAYAASVARRGGRGGLSIGDGIKRRTPTTDVRKWTYKNRTKGR